MAGTGDVEVARPRDQPDDEIETLQALLLGPTAARLDRLQRRVDDPDARAEDVGAVLPRVLVEHAADPHFARALTPPLERALTASGRQNPAPLADALFPVMGPAIRKAVAASLAAMIESLNRTLEHAMSWRSLRWRLEAWRTRKTFAEVVLLKTLRYRVEQVFLIDRRTGLLLAHAQPGSVEVADADMVSGMLTAIRDFARDSFRLPDGESLETLQVGDLAVWVEPGPHAFLAAVIRGQAPRAVRVTLADAIETIHLQFARALDEFDGDASPFAAVRPVLESCLAAEYHAGERRPRTRWAWTAVALVVAAAIVWIGFGVRDRLRLARYVAALRAEPGLTVIDAGRRWGHSTVTGLRDPLARDPVALLAGTGLSAADVEGRWTAYQALDPPIVLARATRTLDPPAGVRLTLDDGVLSAEGAAPPDWLAGARRLAPAIGGVTRFDPSAAVTAAIAERHARLAGRALLFMKGSAALVPGQEDAIAAIRSALDETNAIAAAGGIGAAVVQVVGHADTDGDDDANGPLSLARAAIVQGLLQPERYTHLQFTTIGAGSREPASAGRTEQDLQQNRRVVLRVAAPLPGREPSDR